MIEHYSAHKFALACVYCIRNGLKDAIWRVTEYCRRWAYGCHPEVIVELFELVE